MSGKLNYERERARKEVEGDLRRARQMKENSDEMTNLLFIACAISGKTPEEMSELFAECRARALLETE